MIKSNQL